MPDEPRPPKSDTPAARKVESPATRTVHVNWDAIDRERKKVWELLESGATEIPFDNISESVLEDLEMPYEVVGDMAVLKHHTIIGTKEMMGLVRELGIPCRKHGVAACEECAKLIEKG